MSQKITKLKLPVKNTIDNYFIAGDWHSHAIHIPTLNIMLSHAKTLPKASRKLIINGDFLDAAHLMKNQESFKTWSKRAEGVDDYFIPLSEAEYDWGNKLLDELQKVFSEIIYVMGNHDWRYGWFSRSKFCPSGYSHNFDLSLQLKLKERKIAVVNYNDWLDIGKLSITHGMYHGTSAHKRHFESSGGRSVIFSHIHRLECKAFISRGETNHVWSLPAFCDLNPEYIKNSENNWSHGYGVIHMRSNGTFNFNPVQVWQKKTVLPCGTEITG